MTNILGLDMGTNSIGWAIRDLNSDTEDQIVDYGVVIFKKGVGEGKSGEFSLAAERRVNRSKRRLYNAKRYRKWATLLELSKNEMCPISEEELRLWSIGNWQDGKNRGRTYPTSPDFIAWLAMDFERIGRKMNADVKLKPAYANTYVLRADLLENIDESDTLRLYKIGRAFYHLLQRRGFRTSRKSGKTSYANNELFKKFKEAHPDKEDWKPSQIYLYVQAGTDSNSDLRRNRIRNNAVIQRGLNENEFFSICKKQNIDEALANKIHKAIYFVRPLRTQKGLVGRCTLEKGKTRIPISHPAFEEFRALAFINNLQWREANTKKAFEPIPISLKKQILEQLFFRRYEKGKNKGKVDDGGSLPFEEVINTFSEKGSKEFNFRNNPNISTCPFIAGLMNLFDEEWKNKFIADEDKFGIDWNGLALAYNIKYNGNIVKEKKLNYEEIWHLLFDFLQTKDDEEGLSNFCKEILGWDKERLARFIEITITQGYGSLSKNAIDKIIPFLQQGFIYSEAVSFANLSKVFGVENFETNKTNITSSIADTIKSTDAIKEKLNIVNSLIQEYFADNNTNRAKGVDDHIKEMSYEEVEKKLKDFFGERNWNDKTDDEKKSYTDFVLDKYLTFLDGNQIKEEKASAGINKNPEIDYYRLPRLGEAIKQTLQAKFNASEAAVKKIYHPSDIDIYRKAKHNRLEDPNPPSKGWKNPMAMRTMYELRKLINYLLEVDKISDETKIVVEMSRELNDANKRWAIQTYQRYREEENKEFAKAIIGVAKEKYPNLNENDANNIDKVRLWWEQLENGEEVYKIIKALKEDVEKYRLWKEQGCQCLYTGKIIGLTDLFDGTSFDFEHTLPLSQSFDNSLANLTICDAEYNRKIKKNRMPAQLPNYGVDSNGYKAIAPLIENWVKKVESLKERIEKNRLDTKKSIRAGNIEYKNELVKKRHLLQFDFDYWDKKVKTFTLMEMPNWWKNSQLVDTQIISKYARAYLKSLFNKVDVQKGGITAEFRKIYHIMGDEKKDRSKHSHHAIDAAVLTLIPGSARREAILEKTYKYFEETRKQYHEKPYPKFSIVDIKKIETNILINHVSKDQTLSETKKNVRKRGKIEYLRDKKTKQFTKDENGNKITLKMQGDSIRGKLHADSFYGAIKVNERNEFGFIIKENGKFRLKQKDATDEIWIVSRKEIEKIDFDKDVIIDEILKKHLVRQLAKGVKQDELVDFNDKRIRHLRCRVKAGRGFLKLETAIPIKEHIFKSKHLHKQKQYVQNEDNYLYLLYEGKDENDKSIRGYRILNFFDIAKSEIKNIQELKKEPEYQHLQKAKGKKEINLKLKAILRAGDRVIFYKEHKDEITTENVKDRIFQIYKFNEMTSTGYLYSQFHLEARPDGELGDGDTLFNPEKYQPRLKLTADNFNCLIEHQDFEMLNDGTIFWK